MLEPAGTGAGDDTAANLGKGASARKQIGMQSRYTRPRTAAHSPAPGNGSATALVLFYGSADTVRATGTGD